MSLTVEKKSQISPYPEPKKKSRRNSADKRESVEKHDRFRPSSGNTY